LPLLSLSFLFLSWSNDTVAHEFQLDASRGLLFATAWYWNPDQDPLW
jgi:hypothetical protein